MAGGSQKGRFKERKREREVWKRKLFAASWRGKGRDGRTNSKIRREKEKKEDEGKKKKERMWDEGERENREGEEAAAGASWKTEEGFILF